MIELRFYELSAEQQDQARAMFLDAGTCRDDFWYRLTFDFRVLSRNREVQGVDEYEDGFNQEK